jgi:hypothetical protein
MTDPEDLLHKLTLDLDAVLREARPRFTPPAHTYGTPTTASTFLPMAGPEPEPMREEAP